MAKVDMSTRLRIGAAMGSSGRTDSQMGSLRVDLLSDSLETAVQASRSVDVTRYDMSSSTDREYMMARCPPSTGADEVQRSRTGRGQLRSPSHSNASRRSLDCAYR